MVSKAVVLGGLLFAAVFAGVLVGMQLDGPGDVAGESASPTATPAGTGGGGATPTGTSPPRTTVAPSSFDEGTIESEIRASVNAERESRGLSRLGTFATLGEMARFHSDNMAKAGYVTHGAGGYDTQDRYERYDLAERCKVVDDSSSSIRRGRELEVVAKTTAGRQGSDGRTARDERDVARALVDDWFADETARDRLTMANAEQAGVGVTVAEDGGVYATVDLC